MFTSLCVLVVLVCTSVSGRSSLWSDPKTGDECTCDAFLPSAPFPMNDLAVVEEKGKEISLQLEILSGKVDDYETKVASYAERIYKLTEKIERMEKDPDDYNSEDFEEVKVEIKQVEALVEEMQLSINTTTISMEAIRAQITEMVQTLTRLEKTFDKNLVLQTRREYVKLEADLEDCDRRYQEIFHPNIGSCAHTGITRISKPIVNHINAHFSSSYPHGSWGKDTKPAPNRESLYWFTARPADDMVQIRFYNDYKSLILSYHSSYHNFASGWQGLGNNVLLRDNTLYYQINSPLGFAKYNFTSVSSDYRVVSGVSSKFSYSSSLHQHYDLASDETGLYVIYATDESSGLMLISKINEQSFGIENVMETGIYKPSVTNAFMVCGVLYAVRTIDMHNEEIFYRFDTRTKQGSSMSVTFERFLDLYTYLDYNPTDQKLYMFNQGYMVQYHLWFNHTTGVTVAPPLLDSGGSVTKSL